jgi:DNA mismatch endonuclease (patch repair protein)
MSDSVSKERRSEIMAAVRSKGNKATEMILVKILRRHGVKGWRRHLPLLGCPDFVFRKERLAIFVDGCFWHGCPKHLRHPRANRGYWRHKIERNRKRDLFVAQSLRRTGWRVLRVWEHELKNESRLVAPFLEIALPA